MCCILLTLEIVEQKRKKTQSRHERGDIQTGIEMWYLSSINIFGSYDRSYSFFSLPYKHLSRVTHIYLEIYVSSMIEQSHTIISQHLFAIFFFISLLPCNKFMSRKLISCCFNYCSITKFIFIFITIERKCYICHLKFKFFTIKTSFFMQIMSTSASYHNSHLFWFKSNP